MGSAAGHRQRGAAWVNWSLKTRKMDAGLPLLGIEIWQMNVAF
jgi:hypothetical protein